MFLKSLGCEFIYSFQGRGCQRFRTGVASSYIHKKALRSTREHDFALSFTSDGRPAGIGGSVSSMMFSFECVTLGFDLDHDRERSTLSAPSTTWEWVPHLPMGRRCGELTHSPSPKEIPKTTVNSLRSDTLRFY